MITETERFKSVVRAVVPRTARNWLRSPSRSLEWLWDSARYSLGVKETLEVFPGWSLVCHPHARKIFQQSQIADPEQAAEFRNFILHCSSSMFLYDVGAHYGIFSLAAAHFGGRAIAVDPSPTAARMISTHVVLNDCADSVQVICAAANDTNGAIRLLYAGVFSEGYFTAADERHKRDLTKIQAIAIDEIARQCGPPTHMKIDVEGHEASVLRGAENTLRNYSPLLFLELHNEIINSTGGDPRASLEFLSEVNYETLALDGKPIGRSAILDQAIIRITARRHPQ